MELEEELRQLAPRLLRYCRGRMGDATLAEEASQEALVALVTRWRRHGPPSSPAAFAFAVARRRAARLGWRRRRFSSLLPESQEATEEASPDEFYEHRERYHRALRALACLSRADREALLLVAAGELKTGEAAALLGISPSAMKMRLHRARKRLARQMEGPQ